MEKLLPVDALPDEIIVMANRITDYFAEQNIKEWKLSGIQSRDDTRAPQWQTIESEKGNNGIILVTNGRGTWPARYTYGKDGDGYYELGTHHGRINGVTHWQHLPAPPEVG